MPIIKRNAFKNINKWLTSKKIIILNGPRQVGKTTILREIEKDLKKQNKNCIYLNLEAFQVAELRLIRNIWFWAEISYN